MRRAITTSLILTAFVLAVCGVSGHSPRGQTQENGHTRCCGKKPAYSDPNYSAVFTGQVAIATQFVPNLSDPVLGIYDLKNQSTAPVNSNYAPAVYHGPGPVATQWTKARLGNVFGLTLDNQGNIFTTATTAYNIDFFPTGATGGEVYRIDALTGAITTFVTLPNTMHAGLGNVTYDCEHNNFYVSDVDNGLIYRLSTSGAILGTWDHGLNLPTATPPSAAILDISTQVYTPRGRLAVGIQESNGRLYYAEWPKPSQNTEVWSVGLLPNGAFTGSARREISVPILSGSNAMPVFDISFGPTGTMFLAERGMGDEDSPAAHQSRALEYAPGAVWTPLSPTKFRFNLNTAGLQNSCAGGVGPDFGTNGRVWFTGDALHFGNPDLIYGIEGLPASGGDASNSILIDLDGIVTQQDKTEIGDVEIPCPDVAPSSCKAEFAATTVCPGQATTFTDLSSGATTWSWSFGDSSSSAQQNPTHVYATAGSYNVTLSVNGGACTMTHTVIVSAAPPPPVITGPTTACQTGTYSIPSQPGIVWSVTNGTPASGSGSSITVTWNPTGNGLVSVTVTNPETCCKTTTQLVVHPCDTPSPCCQDVRLDAPLKNGLQAVGGGVYTVTPTLTAVAGLNNITQVSATVISTSLTFTPASCGTSGAANSYITSAAPVASFTFSLPVQFSRDVTWTATNAAGVNMSGGVSFPFNIQFPPPPGNFQCKDSLTFCIKYTFTDVRCKTCEIIRCYTFPRGGGIDVPDVPTDPTGSQICPSPSISWPSVNPVWTLTWTTPDHSVGVDGSGLQLTNVSYKGKQVFHMAHLPVLNVLYDPGGCGGTYRSYRDWQNSLRPFEAANVVSSCSAEPETPPSTVCDHPGSDAGSFAGVAVERKTDQLILTTQMQAGWYRYIQKWFLFLDGTIQVRFYFTAITDYCVNKPHHHHAYWRFDFDIGGAGNDAIEEYNTSGGWTPFSVETSRKNSPSTARKWRVRDKLTGLGYEIIPGPADGIADSWAVADMWALRYRASEIDDGGATSGPTGNAAHLNNFLTGETINGSDDVLWYRAGHRHESALTCVMAGPTLKPVGNW